jgi:hypothetical protein
MVEKTQYSVIEKIEDIEIREYPEMILAVVKDIDEDNAFGLLFNYISGDNKVQDKIKMTAPVISSKKISMTAPVISRDNYMAFILPSLYSKETVPIPSDSKVNVEFHPKKHVAALRFSGRTSDSRIEKMTEVLQSKLKASKIKIKGNPFLMRYNSPFTPWFLRRNEVAVEVLLKEK